VAWVVLGWLALLALAMARGERSMRDARPLQVGLPVFLEQASFVPLKHRPVHVETLLAGFGISGEIIHRASILGFDGKSVVSKKVVILRRKPAGLPFPFLKKTALVPLAKAPDSVLGSQQKTIPRSKGRGYTEEGLIFMISDAAETALQPATSFHTKGTGVGGFVARNLVEADEHDPTVIWGALTDGQLTYDLAGEILTRSAGLPVPETVSLVEWWEFYTHDGRLVSAFSNPS